MESELVADLIFRELSVPADDRSEEFLTKRLDTVRKFASRHHDFMSEIITASVKTTCDCMGVRVLGSDPALAAIASDIVRIGLLLGYMIKEKELRESSPDKITFLR